MISNHEYNKIHKEIENFIESRKFKYNEYLVKNQNTYSDFLSHLEFFYFVTNYISSKKLEARDNEVVLISLFTKAALDLYGIFCCLNNGLEIQAQEISRCLYETSITVELILREDTHERLKLFNEFQHIQRWNQIQFLKENDNDFKMEKYGLNKDLLEMVEKKYLEVKSNYRPKNPDNWAWKIFKDKLNNRNPSMFFICQYLGQEFVNEYIVTYPITSIASHPTQIITDYFIKPDCNYNILVNCPNYTKLTEDTVCISIKDCSNITINILNFFKVDNYAELIEFIKLFRTKVL